MASQPLPASTRSPSRWALAALLAAFVLLWAELFLTAAADEPNTWSGVVTDTIALGIGGGIALGLAALATNKRLARSAAIGCFVAALLFALPFWTGAVIVLGVTASILNRGETASTRLHRGRLGRTRRRVSAGVRLHRLRARYAFLAPFPAHNNWSGLCGGGPSTPAT